MTELHTLARASNTSPRRADDDTDRPAAKTQESSGLITRLGRWWERERRLTPAEIKPLYTARLTDVGANRAAKQWCLQYSAAEGKDRRALRQIIQRGIRRIALVVMGLRPALARTVLRRDQQGGGLKLRVQPGSQAGPQQRGDEKRVKGRHCAGFPDSTCPES